MFSHMVEVLTLPSETRTEGALNWSQFPLLSYIRKVLSQTSSNACLWKCPLVLTHTYCALKLLATAVA